jgi:hypothetical protein
VTTDELRRFLTKETTAAARRGSPFLTQTLNVEDWLKIISAMEEATEVKTLKVDLSGLVHEALVTECMEHTHEKDCVRICTRWLKKLRALL